MPRDPGTKFEGRQWEMRCVQRKCGGRLGKRPHEEAMKDLGWWVCTGEISRRHHTWILLGRGPWRKRPTFSGSTGGGEITGKEYRQESSPWFKKNHPNNYSGQWWSMEFSILGWNYISNNWIAVQKSAIWLKQMASGVFWNLSAYTSRNKVLAPWFHYSLVSARDLSTVQ